MPTSYVCKRCNHISKRLGDLKKHLNRKKICTKTANSYGYTDEELLILSLLPYENNLQKSNKINYIIENPIIIDKDELFTIINDIEINKIKKCSFCEKEFPTLNALKNHVLTNCKLQLSLKKKSEIIQNIHNSTKNMSTTTSTTTTSTTTSTTTNNNFNQINNITNNNSITINLEVKPIISFDKEWDISHLDDAVKQSIFLSSYKFTKFVEHIMKNDKNFNILFDNENNKGTVYINDEFKVMDKNNIVDESMIKIHSQLTQIYNDIKDNNKYIIPEKYLEIEKETTDTKLEDYKKNDTIRKNVIGCMVNIFDKHKDDVIEKYRALEIDDGSIGF